ncbi:MAG: HNH endonuclease [Burkholderiales bacterium]
MGRLYDRRVWRRLREQQLRAHPLCEDCLALGITRPATDVDHRVPLKDGGDALDLANLASRCHACHSSKTAHMDGGFGHARKDRAPIKGCTVDGRPLDPRHWWRDGK